MTTCPVARVLRRVDKERRGDALMCLRHSTVKKNGKAHKCRPGSSHTQTPLRRSRQAARAQRGPRSPSERPPWKPLRPRIRPVALRRHLEALLQRAANGNTIAKRGYSRDKRSDGRKEKDRAIRERLQSSEVILPLESGQELPPAARRAARRRSVSATRTSRTQAATAPTSAEDRDVVTAFRALES